MHSPRRVYRRTMRLRFALLMLLVGCSGTEPTRTNQPPPPPPGGTTGCDVAPGGRQGDVERYRFEKDDTAVTITRRYVAPGTGESTIFDLDLMTVVRTGTCARLTDGLEYENSHHNWRDRARATDGATSYELIIDYDIGTTGGWQISLQTGDTLVENMVVTGAPIGCFSCPGFVPVSISEVQIDNVSTLADEAGDFDPWVELFNPSSSAVDLSGYGLSSDKNDPFAWTFPNGSTIGRHETLIVWLDGEPTEGMLHTSTRFAGGTLRLSMPDGTSAGERSFSSTDNDDSWAYSYETGAYERSGAASPGVGPL